MISFRLSAGFLTIRFMSFVPSAQNESNAHTDRPSVNLGIYKEANLGCQEKNRVL
jgi:hypothetical protein